MSDIPVLHGWRATSVLLVIACHWFPLSPHALRINEAAGAAGMALFFTLSGFLIAGFLANGERLSTFAVKRIARIVPLAWVAMAVLAIGGGYPLGMVARNLGFVANLPPAELMTGGHHLWSLCMEMQFYALVAVACGLLGRARGLALLPVLCIVVTTARGISHEYLSIVTWHRIDEIFAGSTLALVYFDRFGERRWLARLPTYPLGAAFLLSCLPQLGAVQLARPYLAALVVGSTLCSPPGRMAAVLESRFMLAVARMSYALYVIHGLFSDSWLACDPGKYLKRPLLVATTVCLAAVSTRWLERPFNRMARTWTGRHNGERRGTIAIGESPGGSVARPPRRPLDSASVTRCGPTVLLSK